MYHLQRYAAAMSVLEPLYRNIEPIDEVGHLHLCPPLFSLCLEGRLKSPTRVSKHQMISSQALEFLDSREDKRCG